MLKYTRCIASSAPMESSPPFRMWWIVASVRVLRCQHLPSRCGSHQQLDSGWSFPQAVTLRHLLTTSLGKIGRWLVLMIALMVPGLLT